MLVPRSFIRAAVEAFRETGGGFKIAYDLHRLLEGTMSAEQLCEADGEYREDQKRTDAFRKKAQENK